MPVPTFPIPIFVACVLVFAGLQLWRQSGRAGMLFWLLWLCAAQSIIIALNQHYGMPGARSLQPLVASLIPPAAWVAFQNAQGRRVILHALGPLASVAALVVAPQFLDVLLPGLFAAYGGLILVSAKNGADAQPDALLTSGDLPARIWLVIGAALIGSALSDALIVAVQIAGYADLRPWIISAFSVGNLLVVGALSVSPHLQTTQDDTPQEGPPPQVADPHLWARVQAFMDSQKPYLDPDLTLSRFARKLGVPAKALSSTINLATGENVSRFINKARILAAQDALRQGASVTNAMLQSGFNTKSNFNREFTRVVGQSPSAWRKEGCPDRPVG